MQARYKTLPLTDPEAVAPSAKCVIDGLVDWGAWPNDTGEWVKAVTFLPPTLDRGHPHALIVTLEET